MDKETQLELALVWIDKIAAACESVIYETDVSLIDPFELISLINVRLHMEELNSSQPSSPKRKTNVSKTSEENLLLFPNNKKGKKDDTH